jgi:hypothetical protein
MQIVVRVAISRRRFVHHQRRRGVEDWCAVATEITVNNPTREASDWGYGLNVA